MNPEDLLRDLKDPDRWTDVRLPRALATEAGRRQPGAPARTVQLVAAFAIAILTVAGVLVGLESLHRTAAPAATATPSTDSTTSTIAPSIITVTPGPTQEYSATVQPRVCELSGLRLESKQDGGGAAGTYIQSIAVDNVDSDCLLAADSIRVGGAVAKLVGAAAARGFVLPSGATATLVVAAPTACQPGGTVSNLDIGKPILPIVLQIGTSGRTMTARFPQTRCSRPTVLATLSPAAATRFPSAMHRVEVTVDQPSTTPQGSLAYTATLQNTGTEALGFCPTASEVLDNGDGIISTRVLTLSCPPGQRLDPSVPVEVPVTTTIPAPGTWTISWFLGGGVAPTSTATSSVCTLGQLTASEPGPAGGSTGDWIQIVAIRNRGAACMLPAAAFIVDGRAARAGRPASARGIRLPARSSTHLVVAAPTTCADGTMNITATSDVGVDEKPIALQIGGIDAAGLDRPFPLLRCSGPSVDSFSHRGVRLTAENP